MILSIEGNENNMLGYPYKLPRLVEGKKSYIVFYVWNENTGKLERIRREVPKSVDKNRIVKTKEEKQQENTIQIEIKENISTLQTF